MNRQPYECDAKFVCVCVYWHASFCPRTFTVFMQSCLVPVQTDSGLLLAAGSFSMRRNTLGRVGWCQKGNSNYSLPWPISETQLRWCQAALSTVAGNHILNNRQLQHTALPLSPLILCRALGLRWHCTGCMTPVTKLEKRDRQIYIYIYTTAPSGL